MRVTIISAILICFSYSTASKSLNENQNLVLAMKDIDQKMFDAFNHCSDPKQLAIHASFFSKDVEFYHDNGGVTWDRETMINNTKNNACGNYSRKLIDASFEVYPINNYGAITRGSHIFCERATGRCEGKADFTVVWKKMDTGWLATRVLSFGHRENKVD